MLARGRRAPVEDRRRLLATQAGRVSCAHRGERNLNEMEEATPSSHRSQSSSGGSRAGCWRSPAALASFAAPPLGLVAGLDSLQERLRWAFEARGRCFEPSWEELVLGRAALRGFRRAGRRSVNGSCHLVAAADGWVAINLARQEDLELLPALFEQPIEDDLDEALGEAVSGRRSAEVVERGRLLGLAVAACLMPPTSSPPVRARPLGPAARRAPQDPIEVVDLSGLWADRSQPPARPGGRSGPQGRVRPAP